MRLLFAFALCLLPLVAQAQAPAASEGRAPDAARPPAANDNAPSSLVTPRGASRSSTLAELFGRTVYITDHLPPGTRDITEALAQAERRLGPGGGTIRFPASSACYLQTAPHRLAPNVAYEGEGRIPTCISSDFQGDVWIIDAPVLVENTTIRRLNFRSSVPRTSGAAIRIGAAYNTLVEDVSCDLNDYICIDVHSAKGQFKTHLTRPFAPWPGHVGIRIGYGAAGNVDPPTEIYIDTPMIAAHRHAGLQLISGSGIILTNPDLLQNVVNLLIDPGPGQMVTALQSKDGFVDSSIRENLKIAPTGSGGDPAKEGRVTDSTFTGLWTATAGTETGAANILIVGTESSVRSLAFVAPRVFNGGCRGIDIQGGYGIDIVGPQVGQNSQRAHNTCDGIHVAAGVSHWSVTGGRSGPGTEFVGAWQRYGLFVEDGPGDAFAIVGVDLTGNATGGLRNGATGPNQTIVTQGAPVALAGGRVTVVDGPREYKDALAGGATLLVGTGQGRETDPGLRLGMAGDRYGWLQCSRPGDRNLPCLVNPNGGGVALGQASPPPGATTGFAYVGATAGTPTGTPSPVGGMPLSGMAPITVDTVNGRLCAYVGRWRCATLN